ncbi:MAG: outer membrane beta-barrel protein [Chlorobiaceae bacterium]
MKKILLTTVIAISFAMPQAFAVNNNQRGVYAGVDAGYANVKGDPQGAADEFLSLLGGSVSVTQSTSAAMGRIFAGYNINKNFAIELGYNQTTNYTTTVAGVSGNKAAYIAKSDFSVSGIDYSVLIRPIETKSWDGLFAKIGGHFLEPTTSVTLIGTSTASTKISSTGGGFLIGFGYTEPLSSAVDARVAYTYYNSISGNSNNNANVLTVGVLLKL